MYLSMDLSQMRNNFTYKDHPCIIDFRLSRATSHPVIKMEEECAVTRLQLMKTKKKITKPVICICEVNGLIGVVLRQDYDLASRCFWNSIRKAGGKKGDDIDVVRPILINVQPVFVFKAKSKEIQDLKRQCYVERAMFMVPNVSNFPNHNVADVFEYFSKSAPPGLDPITKRAFLVGTHPYSFRSGKPAEILGVEFATPEGETSRPCYRIRFNDGYVDGVPMSDTKNFEIISENDPRVRKTFRVTC